MPRMDSLSDPLELQRCIRDLVALSTLHAVWTSYGPQQIADSVATALVSMLSADFVYVVLPEERGQSLIDWRNDFSLHAPGRADERDGR
jgi:hypothetical protein